MRNLLIILTCLIVPAYTAAAEDNPQVDHSARADSPAAPVPDQSMQKYRDLIAEQEKLHGAMDPQLGEQLLGLGLLYFNRKQYDKAAAVLNRSLQIKRVNDGLQNMDQVPILNALIRVNTALKNWDELNRNYQLLLWVHQRNLKSGDPAILPVIDRVGRWKLMAFEQGLLSEDPSTTLKDLVDLYQSTVNIVEHLYGADDPRLIIPLRGLAIVRYQLAAYINNTPLHEFDGFGQSSYVTVQCRYIPYRGMVIRECEPTEVFNPNYYISKQTTKDMQINIQMNSIHHSLDRIVKISENSPAVSPSDQAKALVDLADWYFLENKRNKALEDYKKAYQILGSDGNNTGNLIKYFGRPMRIPFARMRSGDQRNVNEQVLTKPYVRLAFSVTVDGKARNIKIVESSDPKNFRIHRIAKESIRTSVFRPRFQDGEPVATKHMELVLSGSYLNKASNDRGENKDRHNSVYNGARIPY